MHSPPTERARELRSNTAFLQSRGYRVVRIPIQSLDESIDDVMDTIYRELAADV